MTVQFFEIGTSYAGLANVESLTSVKPNMSPAAQVYEYETVVTLGNGGRRGLGGKSITWTWGYIYADMFDALRTICPGASAEVFIQTRTESGDPIDEDDYTIYTATMWWPELDSYSYRANQYQPFQLRFTNLVEYTP